jgi:hypothetical protein
VRALIITAANTQAGTFSMAKRREGSQSHPTPAERQGGVLAKNSGRFHSPSPRRHTFLRRKKLIYRENPLDYSNITSRFSLAHLGDFERLYKGMVMKSLLPVA